MNKTTWRQIGGDMDPGSYGGTIARFDGDHVEVRQIQPVREYVGDEEAIEVGFPFWTREGYYDSSDLDVNDPDMQEAMKFCGLQEEDLPEEKHNRLFALAECALLYGLKADEGPAGWAEDVVPGKVRWASGKMAGWKYLADEDDEFMGLLPVTVRETYEIITPESAEIGDAEERGWIDEEGTEYTAERFVNDIEGAEPSSSKFNKDIWYTIYLEQDAKGNYENRSYHLDKKTPIKLQEWIYKQVKGRR